MSEQHLFNPLYTSTCDNISHQHFAVVGFYFVESSYVLVDSSYRH